MRQLHRHEQLLALWRDCSLADLLTDMHVLLQLCTFREYQQAGGYDPGLCEAAKQATHAAGLPWTDPRTGVVYPP